jgi:outer membrane protein TolC
LGIRTDKSLTRYRMVSASNLFLHNHHPPMRTWFIAVTVGFLYTFLSCAVFGQSQVASPDSALVNILGKLEGTRLSLAEAARLARENATSVRSAEASSAAANGAERREAGAFDPSLFLSYNYFDQREPTASFFAGADILSTVQATGSAGIRMNLPIGTTVQASLDAVRLNSNSSFAFLNPQYTTLGTLSLRQPLLGGFHVSARKSLTKAEQDAEAAKARYDQAVLEVNTSVEQQYWDLYAAERDYAVQLLTRDRADAFLKDTETRAKTGLIGPNQVANARTFLAEQEILLLDREENLDRLSDQLASQIGTRPSGGEKRYLVTDTPPDTFPEEDVDVLVARAIQENLQLRAARADVESKKTLSKAAAWEAMPQVAFVGSIGSNGLAGTARDVIFGADTLRTIVGGGFNDAVQQAIKRNYPSWSVGLEVTIPIGLRSGLGERDRVDAEVVVAEQEYIRQSRVLEENVRGGYRDLFHGKRRLQAAREGVAAAQEQVRIGLIEFANGRSTAFELVRLGADFAVAQQRYSEAIVRSANAAATLRQLTSGTYPAAQ